MYKRQMEKGKVFLHEHPAQAGSWSEGSIIEDCEEAAQMFQARKQMDGHAASPIEPTRSTIKAIRPFVMPNVIFCILNSEPLKIKS